MALDDGDVAEILDLFEAMIDPNLGPADVYERVAPEVSIIGTADGETNQGRDVIFPVMDEEFQARDTGDRTVVHRWQVVDGQGDVAWVADDSIVRRTAEDGHVHEARVRSTFIFARREEGWVMIHGHYSCPRDNEDYWAEVED
jgi:ketosteroid isomerase-like protein